MGSLSLLSQRLASSRSERKLLLPDIRRHAQAHFPNDFTALHEYGLGRVVTSKSGLDKQDIAVRAGEIVHPDNHGRPNHLPIFTCISREGPQFVLYAGVNIELEAEDYDEVIVAEPLAWIIESYSSDSLHDMFALKAFLQYIGLLFGCYTHVDDDNGNFLERFEVAVKKIAQGMAEARLATMRRPDREVEGYEQALSGVAGLDVSGESSVARPQNGVGK